MPHYKVAHLREQGQDMIIIPLDSSFGHQSASEQDATIEELQSLASAAGLAGTVVPVWNSGGGGMKFIAPKPWHPFFQGLSLAAVHSNLNKQISW